MSAVVAAGLDGRSAQYVEDVLSIVEELVPVSAAFLIGSTATGAFEPGASDLDLVLVLDRPLGSERRPLVRRLLALPRPVRDLELVAYVDGRQPPDFELNVSQGGERPDEDAFWFVLDAALGEQHAVQVRGTRPWSHFFAPVPEEAVRAAMRESFAWSQRQPPDDEFARINAVRVRRYLADGEWISKKQAREELGP